LKYAATEYIIEIRKGRKREKERGMGEGGFQREGGWRG